LLAAALTSRTLACPTPPRKWIGRLHDDASANIRSAFGPHGKLVELGGPDRTPVIEPDAVPEGGMRGVDDGAGLDPECAVPEIADVCCTARSAARWRIDERSSARSSVTTQASRRADGSAPGPPSHAIARRPCHVEIHDYGRRERVPPARA
jgi:hypothetical protein